MTDFSWSLPGFDEERFIGQITLLAHKRIKDEILSRGLGEERGGSVSSSESEFFSAQSYSASDSNSEIDSTTESEEFDSACASDGDIAIREDIYEFRGKRVSVSQLQLGRVERLDESQLEPNWNYDTDHMSPPSVSGIADAEAHETISTERFLDALADLFSYKDRPDHVSATAMRKGEDGISIFIAKNGGPDSLDRYVGGLIQTWFSTLDTSFTEEDMKGYHFSRTYNAIKVLKRMHGIIPWHQAIGVDESLQTGICEVTGICSRIKLQESILTSYPKNPKEWLKKWRERSTTPNTNLDNAMKSAAELLVHPSFNRLYNHSDRNRLSATCRALEILGRVPLLYRTLNSYADTYLRPSTSYKSGEIPVKIEFLEKKPITRRSPTKPLLLALSPLEIDNMDDLEEVTKLYENNFQKYFGAGKVHAELQVLAHVCSKHDDAFKVPYNYIGISKKTCRLCHTILQGIPIRARRTHEKVYPEWCLPPFLIQDPQMYNAVVSSALHMQQTTTQQLAFMLRRGLIRDLLGTGNMGRNSRRTVFSYEESQSGLINAARASGAQPSLQSFPAAEKDVITLRILQAEFGIYLGSVIRDPNDPTKDLVRDPTFSFSGSVNLDSDQNEASQRPIHDKSTTLWVFRWPSYEASGAFSRGSENCPIGCKTDFSNRRLPIHRYSATYSYSDIGDAVARIESLLSLQRGEDSSSNTGDDLFIVTGITTTLRNALVRDGISLHRHEIISGFEYLRLITREERAARIKRGESSWDFRYRSRLSQTLALTQLGEKSKAGKNVSLKRLYDAIYSAAWLAMWIVTSSRLGDLLFLLICFLAWLGMWIARAIGLDLDDAIVELIAPERETLAWMNNPIHASEPG